ncbi:DUF4286 family protein [Barnesiella sp. WM24]|uniref:DUF4286 family protein n=1 Tax=Barnesiella sp. WM24 TaxID=2558278 RepID=UPI00107221C0|nr:DUF4286 family protein [Barnesiella sp. WM24]TFU93695.1 DUF4286 family protein [Barnesiella sp. WM24]
MVVNTTFHVEESAEAEFIEWIKTEYIPEAQESVKLHSPLFMRILTPMEGGVGYAVQLQAMSKAHVETWIDSEQPRLLSAMARKFGKKVMFFTTVMEKVK